MAKDEKKLETFEIELAPVKAEVATIRDQAEKFEIKTDEDYEACGNLAGIVNDKSKAIDKMRKFFTDPLNAQVKSINGVFNPQIDEADAIVKLLKGKMSVYFTAKEEARIKEQKRLDDIRITADKKREEQGKEAIAAPVREVAAPVKTVIGAAKSTVRKVWKHEVLSMSELPLDIQKAIFAEAYKKGIVNTVVQKFVDAGIREMTGVRIYEDSIIALSKGR